MMNANRTMMLAWVILLLVLTSFFGCQPQEEHHITQPQVQRATLSIQPTVVDISGGMVQETPVKSHLRSFITDVLVDFSVRRRRPLDSHAIDLLVLTASIETRQGRYLYSLGGGSDTGVYQFTMYTYNDIYDNYLNYFPELRELVDSYRSPTTPLQIELAGNLAYQTVLAYVQYERLLNALDVQKWPPNQFLQVYWWKLLWNTRHGLGTGFEAFKAADFYGLPE